MPATLPAIDEIQAELAQRGIELHLHGDRLRYRPQTEMTDDLAEKLKAHKSELMAALSGDPAPASQSRADREWDRFLAVAVRTPTGGLCDPAHKRLSEHLTWWSTWGTHDDQ